MLFSVSVLVLALSAVVLSAPQGNPEDITVVRYVNDNNGIDQYQYT